MDAEPIVYFARAVDGRRREIVLDEGRAIAAEVASSGMRLLDPVAEWDTRVPGDATDDPVQADLRLLHTADGVLMDMTVPGHQYIGCICELTYAHLWQLPSVVWVADTGLEQRMWLRHHATVIVRKQSEAIDTLAALLGGPFATGD
ncbi:MAG: hypothetical protein HKP61_07775 [Dactylosporangium sp.]|nr:hypothetical protein [Dactylosporangium sp.]NNJ60835.1 hypothetical protein [Dactylosporangium sp.]